jgi:hypothetical protein
MKRRRWAGEERRPARLEKEKGGERKRILVFSFFLKKTPFHFFDNLIVSLEKLNLITCCLYYFSDGILVCYISINQELIFLTEINS